MMPEHQLAAAFALDLLLGDPRWFPHPVKLIASLAIWLERGARSCFKNERVGGAVTALMVILTTGAFALLLVVGAGAVSDVAAEVVSVVIIYFSLALRDLLKHSREVLRALEAGDLPRARSRVAMIVGRDTKSLNEAEITRAVVESVAENLTDGVIAPLLYAAICGPVGAIMYKAINTLDSMFGYKNERYIKFGWASARIDDVANYIPARVAGVSVILASLFLGLRPLNSIRVFFRDGQNHPSPNSGLTEAAVAGALGVRLGGLSHYDGEPSEKPTIGEPLEPLNQQHIKRVNVLVFSAALIVVTLVFWLR